jgi:hypothetical protein
MKPQKANGGEMFSDEAEFVEKLCTVLPDHLSSPDSAVRLAREVNVGRVIVDVVALRAQTDGRLYVEDVFTTRESVILSLLRVDGPTRIDLLENRCGIARGGLREGALTRLLTWGIVSLERGGRVTMTHNAFPVNIVAIEAKLTKWREALSQAIEYRRFADHAYVALPSLWATPAIKSSEVFEKHGIGLMVLSGDELEVVVEPEQDHAHDWRREFVLSRLLASGHDSNACLR